MPPKTGVNEVQVAHWLTLKTQIGVLNSRLARKSFGYRGLVR